MDISTKYRTIKTEIPVPDSIPLYQEMQKYEARGMHNQLPILWDRAEDFQVYDKFGNKWIDFTSTIFVANIGHSNPELIKALHEQLDKLIHSYTFLTEVRVKFLKELIEFLPPYLEKAFLVSSGTEAVERAIQIVRMKDRKKIVSFKGSMHGKTMGSLTLSKGGQDIHLLPFPYPWTKNDFYKDVQEINPKEVCAFIIESYQGWGAIMYPQEYIDNLIEFARKHNILIVFDEIQGGFGRTGKLFAYQHYGVEPDLVCLGKAIGGGLPLSALVGRKELMDLPDEMSSTHSANPISCAAGLATLKIIKPLISESARKGEILHQRLNELKLKYPKIKHVLGKGLLAGLIFENDAVATAVCWKAMRKGLLLVYTGRESVKIGPPLTIPIPALLEGISVIEECLK